MGTEDHPIERERPREREHAAQVHVDLVGAPDRLMVEIRVGARDEHVLQIERQNHDRRERNRDRHPPDAGPCIGRRTKREHGADRRDEEQGRAQVHRVPETLEHEQRREQQRLRPRARHLRDERHDEWRRPQDEVLGGDFGPSERVIRKEVGCAGRDAGGGRAPETGGGPVERRRCEREVQDHGQVEGRRDVAGREVDRRERRQQRQARRSVEERTRRRPIDVGVGIVERRGHERVRLPRERPSGIVLIDAQRPRRGRELRRQVCAERPREHDDRHDVRGEDRPGSEDGAARRTVAIVSRARTST
jgi:hypothetical protein